MQTIIASKFTFLGFLDGILCDNAYLIKSWILWVIKVIFKYKKFSLTYHKKKINLKNIEFKFLYMKIFLLNLKKFVTTFNY